MEMERGDPGFGTGMRPYPGQGSGKPGSSGKPDPCCQAAVQSDSPGFPGKELRGEARTRDLPPHLLAAEPSPAAVGRPWLGAVFLSSDTSKGQAAPAALLVALKKHFSPLNILHTSANTPRSEQGRIKPAGLPPISGTGGSVSTALQVQPPPLTHQDAPLLYSPRAPFMPLLCNGGKSFL